MIQGREIHRSAVPAEDMMQAFLYRHLVPMKDLMVMVAGRQRFGSRLQVIGDGPVRLSPGRKSWLRIAGPRAQYLKQVELELSVPPKGIAIDKVTFHEKGGFAIALTAKGV